MSKGVIETVSGVANRCYFTYRLNLLVLIRVGCRNIHFSCGRYVVGLKQQLKAQVNGGYIRIAETLYRCNQRERCKKPTSTQVCHQVLSACLIVCLPACLLAAWNCKVLVLLHLPAAGVEKGWAHPNAGRVLLVLWHLGWCWAATQQTGSFMYRNGA